MWQSWGTANSAAKLGSPDQIVVELARVRALIPEGTQQFEDSLLEATNHGVRPP